MTLNLVITWNLVLVLLLFKDHFSIYYIKNNIFSVIMRFSDSILGRPKLSLNQECTVSTSSKYQCTFITCVLLVCCVVVPHMYASGLNNSNKKSKPRSVQRPCNTVLSATFFSVWCSGWQMYVVCLI